MHTQWISRQRYRLLYCIVDQLSGRNKGTVPSGGKGMSNLEEYLYSARKEWKVYE